MTRLIGRLLGRPRRPAAPPPARLGVEALEARDVPAVWAQFYPSFGQLVVTGDAAGDTIQIVHNTYRSGSIDRLEQLGTTGETIVYVNGWSIPITLMNASWQAFGATHRLAHSSYTPTSIAVYAGGGNDRVELTRNTTFSTPLTAYLYGQWGNDTIILNQTGTLGGSTMLGYLYGDDGDDYLRASWTIDAIYGGSGNDTIYAGEYNDLVDAGSNNDWVHAGSGDDTVYGGLDADYLFGGTGHDLLDGGSGDDTLDGADGNDRLYGGYGNDVMYGGWGNDDLRGWHGADVMYGGPDNDTLYGEGGGNTMFGEDGNDLLDAGNDWNADTLDGGAGDDTLRGWGAADTLLGGDGNDWLDGGDGNDMLFGGAGTNQLFGGAGADRLLTWDAASDNVRDKTDADARIKFERQGETTHQGVKYAAASWTAAEILKVDVGLGAIHARLGNTRMLRESNGSDVVFRRVGGELEGANNVAAWNFWGPFVQRTITMTDKAFDHDNPAHVAVHELAHNWQENYRWDEWKRLGGWSTSFQPGLIQVGWTDAGWWFNPGSGFASPYGMTNPKEDWSEMWVRYFFPTDPDVLRSQFGNVTAKLNFLNEFFSARS